MESLTKDMCYQVRRAATSWGKRRKRNGLGRGKDREMYGIPKWQVDDDYISRGTGFGESVL